MLAAWRKRKAMREAALWRARMAEPESPEEVAAFEAWLARDPLHARFYEELDAVMAASGAVPREARGVTPVRPALLRPAPAFGIAALALVSAAVLWQGTSTPAFATISNSGSAVRSVRLDEGTRVWLDVGAVIGIRLTDERREIEVRGGRVRVVPAADPRPLIIEAGAASASPGLTRTDVTTASGRTTFGAIDGPLAVDPSASTGERGPLRVAAGRALALDTEGAGPAALDRLWIVGRVRFSEAPLHSVLAFANRFGEPDIVAGDEKVAGLRVSGVFDLRDTRRLARKLAAAMDLRVEEQDARLVLRR